jgi:hypothetical protein
MLYDIVYTKNKEQINMVFKDLEAMSNKEILNKYSIEELRELRYKAQEEQADAISAEKSINWVLFENKLNQNVTFRDLVKIFDSDEMKSILENYIERNI